MSKELAAAAIVIAIISKRKNTGRNRKRRTVWVKPWLCRLIENNFKLFRQGSLALPSLYHLASHPTNICFSAILQRKLHLLPLFYLHPFVMLKFSPYCILPRVPFIYRRCLIKKPISNYQSMTFVSLNLIFVILS